MNITIKFTDPTPSVVVATINRLDGVDGACYYDHIKKELSSLDPDRVEFHFDALHSVASVNFKKQTAIYEWFNLLDFSRQMKQMMKAYFMLSQQECDSINRRENFSVLINGKFYKVDWPYQAIQPGLVELTLIEVSE